MSIVQYGVLSVLYIECVAQVLVCSREQTSSLEPDRLAGAADSSDPLLAFPSPVLARLHNRTEELKQEKNATKSKYKEARSMFENLQLECRALRKGIAGTSRRCEVEMEKRFGAGVSLETLESFAVNRTLEEMKESSRTKEKVMWKIQNKREEHIKDVRYSLHQRVLRCCTSLVQRVPVAISSFQAVSCLDSAPPGTLSSSGPGLPPCWGSRRP